MTTANSLKQLRLDKGWTQEQLAGISGVSVRTIQRIEQGGPPALESAKALAAAFGLPLAELHLNGKDPSMTTGTHTPADPVEQLIVSLKRHCQTPERQKRRFWHHLATYAVVIGGLTAFNLSHNPDHLWVLYPAVIWGIFLAYKALLVFIARERNAPDDHSNRTS